MKNKVAPPFKSVQVEIIYGQGLSYIGELIDLGVSFDIIDKAGSWYAYKDDKIGQGKDAVRNYLTTQPHLLEEIDAAIRKHAFPEKQAIEIKAKPKK